MSQARPFLKWAGGKQRLVGKLAPLLPRTFRVYYEPFLGGGALFWHLGPRKAVLGDMNERLVRTYRAVQRDPSAVASALRKVFPAGRLPTEAEYLSIRDSEPDAGSDLEVAAWLLYVNRFGFNGLYRVNRAGKYNVAFGPPKRPPQVDEVNLKACSLALRYADILHGPFDETVRGASDGDFAYFDPPYDPIASNPYGFISYTAEKFGAAHQKRLRDVALGLSTLGCAVAVSNALTPRVLGLYEGGSFFVVPLLAPRTLNCDVKGRGQVHEVVILTQPPPRQKVAPRSAAARTLPMPFAEGAAS
jgi:DNA adenine methylase